MMWGSYWASTAHIGLNPLFNDSRVPVSEFVAAQESQGQNPGGSQFTHSEPISASAGINPLLRVRPVSVDESVTQVNTDTPHQSISTTNPVLSPTLSTRGHTSGVVRGGVRPKLYATNAFERRQPMIPRSDSRWSGAQRRDLNVPEIDAQLVVASQKLLRDEELEFHFMISALVAAGEIHV